jgi:Cys-tRNA(Pro)/Cys-tRNA(Cys) deacylase
MSPYEQQLHQFMQRNAVAGEHLIYAQSCHSVAEAAEAAGVTAEDLIKSIGVIDAQGNLIVAIVKGEDKVSTSRVAKALQLAEYPLIATPEEMLAKTGYPCGGTPAFGYPATFLIDPRVFEKAIVYSGGGSEQALVRSTPQELQRVNGAQIVRVRR